VAREIIYQYNGRESKRESPILDGDDSISLPNADEIIGRRGTHYRVRSVKHYPAIAGLLGRCIVDIAPIYPLPSGD
jgi:hypothetical protein